MGERRAGRHSGSSYPPSTCVHVPTGFLAGITMLARCPCVSGLLHAAAAHRWGLSFLNALIVSATQQTMTMTAAATNIAAKPQARMAPNSPASISPFLPAGLVAAQLSKLAANLQNLLDPEDKP